MPTLIFEGELEPGQFALAYGGDYTCQVLSHKRTIEHGKHEVDCWSFPLEALKDLNEIATAAEDSVNDGTIITVGQFRVIWKINSQRGPFIYDTIAGIAVTLVVARAVVDNWDPEFNSGISQAR